MVQICLWCNGTAVDAAELYTRVLRDGAVNGKQRYDSAGAEQSGLPEGSTMAVTFEAEGQRFLALNGGPNYQPTPAVSMMIQRDTQVEIDAAWEGLLEGGGEAGRCGWLIDRFGFSWQVVPSMLSGVLGGPDRDGAARATQAMLGMNKLVIADLQAAYQGG